MWSSEPKQMPGRTASCCSLMRRVQKVSESSPNFLMDGKTKKPPWGATN